MDKEAEIDMQKQEITIKLRLKDLNKLPSQKWFEITDINNNSIIQEWAYIDGLLFFVLTENKKFNLFENKFINEPYSIHLFYTKNVLSSNNGNGKFLYGMTINEAKDYCMELREKSLKNGV